MLRDVVYVEPENGEPYHRATLVTMAGGLPIPIRGWRRFKDGRVEPPGARWSKTGFVVPPSQDILEMVNRLFDYALTDPVARVYDDALRLFDRDPAACKRAYPQLYRSCFVDRNPDWAREFGALPEGRLWPDRMLEAVVAGVKSGNLPHEDLLADIESGVLSKADARRVNDLLDADNGEKGRE